VVDLDEFLPRQGLPRVGILKIDAEGWDLEVLKGAERTAAEADVVLLGAMVMCPHFENRLGHVISEMDRRDFVPFDSTDLNRTARHEALWMVEIAFVKRDGPLHSAVDRYD